MFCFLFWVIQVLSLSICDTVLFFNFDLVFFFLIVLPLIELCGVSEYRSFFGGLLVRILAQLI